MILTVLNSGSRGNGYVLQNDNEALVIECGVGINSCLKALGYNVSKVAACLVSHEHGDHCKYIDSYMEMMPVFCSHGTASAIKYKSKRRPHTLECLEKVTIGNFEIMPFDTQHDCAEPFGFLISHPDIGLLLFATDTYYLKYKFEGLNAIMLECNYDINIMNENIEKGSLHPLVKKRTLRSHMSLETTIKTLQANDLKKVTHIILLHLSGQNSDPEKFKKDVELSVGKNVTIAKTGVIVKIGKTPF